MEVSRALKLLGGVGPALLRHADAVRLADCDLGIARGILSVQSARCYLASASSFSAHPSPEPTTAKAPNLFWTHP
jgi:hypothetical protein